MRAVCEGSVLAQCVSAVFKSKKSKPGNVEKEKTLQLEVLNFRGQVCAVTLERGQYRRQRIRLHALSFIQG